MSLQMQLCLFDELPKTVDALIARREDQWFDRKSFRISARDLADVMIGFANADGGRVVIGIHEGRVEGINSSPEHLNKLLQAALDFSQPPVKHSPHFIDCTNAGGKPDRLLLVDIESSERLHRNRKQDCYLRVGDETRKLGPDEERELAFAKGDSVFDASLLKGLLREDLDQSLIDTYAQQVGTTDIAALLRSRGLYHDAPHRTGVTQAGWLLFGKVPPVWSYVRYLRYAGVGIETGVRSNLTDDVRLDGTIPSLIDQARILLNEKVDRVIRLAPNGRFERMPALPEFAWLEAIVNAVTHRSYSLQGDGIRVTQFDDRLEVESPGRLPGPVRIDNIRHTRFARNPHIARVLAEMTGYVRELNEGVKRMFEEMEQFGLHPPVYMVTDSTVRVTLYKRSEQLGSDEQSEAHLSWLRERLGERRLHSLLVALREQEEMSSRQVAVLLNVTPPTARSYLRMLEGIGMVSQRRKSPRDPATVWVVTKSALWQQRSLFREVT